MFPLVVHASRRHGKYRITSFSIINSISNLKRCGDLFLFFSYQLSLLEFCSHHVLFILRTNYTISLILFCIYLCWIVNVSLMCLSV